MDQTKQNICHSNSDQSVNVSLQGRFVSEISKPFQRKENNIFYVSLKSNIFSV